MTTKYFAAITEALDEAMAADDSVVVIGEDVGKANGIYAQTRGLFEKYGADRVMDAPDAELGYLGAGVGAAMTGLRPVVEISFADFFPISMDQLVNQAARIRFMSGGQVGVPLTVLSFGGAGLKAGPQHSGTYEAWLGSIPGLKVVTPAFPSDVKGLIATAIADEDPVVVLLHKGLLQKREDLGTGVAPVPLGSALTRREGDDVTIVSWSATVHTCLEAAEKLAADGVSVEVIDLRSIQPLDIGAVVASVTRTNRLVVAHETTEFAGIGAEVTAQVQTLAFDHLDAPVERVAAPFTPVPYTPPLEEAHLPQVDDVVAAARRSLR